MTLAIVTPSHAPDFLSFRRLHDSVVRHAPADAMHYVLVPAPDVGRFSSIGSDRLTVLRQSDFLPRSFVTTTRLGRIPRLPRGYRVGAVNIRRPWPPIRGWVLQQVVKLSFVSTLDTDVALMVDSDALLVRGFGEDTFRRGASVRHLRVPQALHSGMPRHLKWRETAGRLLGLDTPSGDYADYNAGVVSWSPDIVRLLVTRIEVASSRPWAAVVGAQLDVSEYFLYGEYLAALGTPDQRAFTSHQSLCHSCWRTLTLASADAFVDSIPPIAIAILVQSNSGTSDEVLDHIAATIRDR